MKIYSDQNGYPLKDFEIARRVLESIRHDIDNHKFDPTKYIKLHMEAFYFSTQIETWFKRKEKYAKKKETLAASYVRVLKSYKEIYFKGFFGDIDVRETRTAKIKEFYEGLPIHLSSKTQLNIMTALQNFFNELVEDEIIEISPSFKKILKLIDVKEQEIKWFEHVEQEEILAYIEQSSKHRKIIEFMCETGVRPGEAMAIFLDDFDSKDILLRVSKTFSDRQFKNTTKSGRINDVIPLSAKAVEIIRSLPKGSSTFMFVNPDTRKHYVLDSLDRLWKKVRDHFKIDKKIKLYNFTKHSFATQIARAGGTPHEIKDLLRHSDIRTSLKYTGKDMTALRARLKKRAKLIAIEDRKKKAQ